ncbi:hypothetical protein V7127_02560 [Bacillus sp. JJ1773]|uniref:hypothetical protein n=1 Tax=Bacillus sp. JJ1773 TaxID=3122965 RepID=UPI002FFF83D3
MNFKDQLKKDLSVFINPNEFAEEVDIDGTKVSVIIDNDKLKEHQLKMGGEGLVENGLLFHVKKGDMPFIPRPEQRMNFKESLCYIVDVQEDEGVYTITLEGFES